MPVVDDRVNSYCNLRDVTRYYKVGEVQPALTPSTIATVTVTMASVADAAKIKPGDTLKLSSTQSPRGEYREVINVTSTAVTLDSAVAGTYTTGLSVVVQSSFTPTSLPSTDDVLDLIRDIEDEIDRQCEQSWRVVTMSTPYRPEVKVVSEGGRQFSRVWLNHKDIVTFATASGDAFYVWDGTTEVEYVATKTNNRTNGDYWLNETDGYIDIFAQNLMFHDLPVKVSKYRYGHVGASNVPNPPRDIRKATAMLVAAELFEMEPTINMHPSGGGDLDAPKPYERSDRLRADAQKILSHHTRLVII